MLTKLKTPCEEGERPARAADLVRGAAVTCDFPTRSKATVERVAPDEGLIVLRVASRRARPKTIPAHFLVLSYGETDGEIVVESEPVMTLPARKGGFERDKTVYPEAR
jgi:hypothetical protein